MVKANSQLPEQIVNLVVASRHGAGFDFDVVKTSAAFQKRLHAITVKADDEIRGLNRCDYAIADDLEDDEYMICTLALRSPPVQTESSDEISTVAPKRLGRVPRRMPATTKEPKEFRRLLVTTMTPYAPVGADFLKKTSIAFYAIVRGDEPAQRVAYVRHLNPLRLAKPGNVIAMLGDSLVEAAHPVFALDERTDLIIRADDVIIRDKNFFESLFFGLSGEGPDLDGIVLSRLNVLPFSDETTQMLVERARGRKRVRRKMLEIWEANHLENVTIDDFKKALAAEGIEHSRFIDDDGMIRADKADGDLLLQILNEDLFKGALTGRSLAASRKKARK